MTQSATCTCEVKIAKFDTLILACWTSHYETTEIMCSVWYYYLTLNYCMCLVSRCGHMKYVLRLVTWSYVLRVWSHEVCSQSVVTCSMFSEYGHMKYVLKVWSHDVCSQSVVTCSMFSKCGHMTYVLRVWSHAVCSQSVVTCSMFSEYGHMKYVLRVWSHAVCSQSVVTCSMFSKCGHMTYVLKVWSHDVCSQSVVTCSMFSECGHMQYVLRVWSHAVCSQSVVTCSMFSNCGHMQYVHKHTFDSFSLSVDVHLRDYWQGQLLWEFPNSSCTPTTMWQNEHSADLLIGP